MRDVVSKLALLLDQRGRRGAIPLVALMLGGAALDMLGTGAIPAFVALLGTPEGPLPVRNVQAVFEALGAGTKAERVLWAALALGALFLLKNAYIAIYLAIEARYAARVHVQLSDRLFRAYVRSPYAFHLQRNGAELLYNTTAAAHRVVQDVVFTGFRLAGDVLVLCGMLSLLVAVEPVVGPALVLLLGSVSALVYRSLRRRATRFGEVEHRSHRLLIQAIGHTLGGAKEVKVLGREDYFLGAVDRLLSEYARAQRGRVALAEAPRLYLETIAVLGMLLLVACFVAAGRPLAMVMPVLTLAAVVAVRLIPAANRVVNAVVAMRWAEPALRTVHAELCAIEPTLPTADAPGPPLLRLAAAIELVDVSYRYPGAAAPALSGITLRIPRGCVAGFAGPSGSGKTTLVDVLTGLLTPTTGKVLVDGVDVGTSLAGWQRQLGYVPQSVYIAEGTIRSNVAFGIAEAMIDDRRVWAALEAAHLGEFVRQLPAALLTRVGERGARLSGGQGQRIGIARALYHDPAVLVFDEGTAALDDDTEALVMDAVEGLRGTRTIVVVAHRRQTLERCNPVFVLAGGRLARTEVSAHAPSFDARTASACSETS